MGESTSKSMHKLMKKKSRRKGKTVNSSMIPNSGMNGTYAGGNESS